MFRRDRSNGASLMALATLAMAFTAEIARADMGSVWVESVGANHVTVNWSLPRGVHEQVGSTYRVCWQPADSSERICLTNQRVVNERPFSTPDLEPGTEYRFHVETYATKLNLEGRTVNAKFRKTGEVRQSTRGTEPGQNLEVVATDAGSMTIRLRSDVELDFSEIRVAYKAKWNTDQQLNEVAQGPNGPEREWRHSDASSGWSDEHFPADEVSGPYRDFTFEGLDRCQAYEVVAYGLDVGSDLGVKLGSAMAQTAGFCPQTTVDEAVADDHEDVLEQYAGEITVGGTVVFEIVEPSNPWITEIREIILVDAGDDLENDLTALQFLIRERPAEYATWQSGLSLQLTDFVASRHSTLHDNIIDELDEAPVVFRRGNVNNDLVVDISDGISILNFLFLGEAQLLCRDAADINDDRGVDLADGVYLFSYLFNGGRRPAEPFETCGSDPTDDDLDCGEYSGCSLSS